MKIHKNLINYMLIIIWMLLIFWFSNQVADDSNTMSLGITQTIYNILQRFNIDKVLSYEMMNHLIRKLAHFSVYFVLGILVVRVYQKPIAIKTIIKTICICFFYACTDEIHQNFIPGRAMMFTDVLIDTLGASVGVLLYRVLSLKVIK